MKKIGQFLRSMRFGMILLGTIAALSIIGTLVEQGQNAEFYSQTYGNLGNIITFLGFDHMYSTWYYAALFAALCLNLLLCSVLRFGKVKSAKAALLKQVQNAKVQEQIDARKAETVCKNLGFKPCGNGLYIARPMGLYGSFITHIGMLLLVIAAASVFAMESKESVYIIPGESASISDGCSIAVDGFSMENEQGQLDYISCLTVTGKDGTEKEITTAVNHPARFEDHTIYQQDYRFAAVLEVQTALEEQAEQVILDGSAFISLDGISGIQYLQVYGDYTTAEDGEMMPLQSREMKNPAYLMAIIDHEKQQIGVTLPGETFEIGGVYYTFREPTAYPGLQIKTQPTWIMPILYTSFAVLVLGLYLCFFCVPAALCFKDGKVRVLSGKDVSDVPEQLQNIIENMED